MNIESLRQTPPWEWPKDAAATLLLSLRDPRRAPDEREVAASLAGDLVVMNDEIAVTLASLASDRAEPENVRAAAAISLGPVLEQTEMEGFEDDGISEPPITERTLKFIQKTLRGIYSDTAEPLLVRRRAFEASVRFPDDWHADAIRAAYSGSEHDWKLTAVFAMQYVPGFDQQILESLASNDPELQFEAVRAAGAQGLAAAWPRIESLLTSPETDRDLRLAAIEAAVTVAPEKAAPILVDLCDSEDEEIAEAAADAMSDAEGDEP